MEIYYALLSQTRFDGMLMEIHYFFLMELGHFFGFHKIMKFNDKLMKFV